MKRHYKKHLLRKDPPSRFLKQLQEQNDYYGGTKKPHVFSVVTARGYTAAIRCIETFHHWGMDIDGVAHFTAGKSKADLLKVIAENAKLEQRAVRFYDDQGRHVAHGRDAGIFRAGAYRL